MAIRSAKPHTAAKRTRKDGNAAADSDTPPAQFILAADLTEATQSGNKSIELAARREYWRYLNYDYRDLYRAHREEEDNASQAMWESEWHIANPDTRSIWRKLFHRISFTKPAILQFSPTLLRI